MSNVITITRQFGSMGRHIGMQVAEIMGYKYLDRDILEDTAKKMDISLERLLLLEDKDIKGYHRMAYPFGFGDGVMQRKMFQVQSNLVKHYAESENCVIIGRCADYVLKDWDNVFSVFIYAPYLDRIENSVDKLGIKASELLSMKSITRGKSVIKNLPERSLIRPIIGGGISGAALGYHLSLYDEAEIVLFEKDRIGCGTTAKSAGTVCLMIH